MWTQIVGKIRLTLSRDESLMARHVYVTSRGLTTSPYLTVCARSRYALISSIITRHSYKRWQKPNNRTETGVRCEFYRIVMKTLEELNLRDNSYDAERNRKPILFDQDEKHRSYDREYAIGFWRVLCQSDRCLKNSLPGSVASAVRCIFSGAALISRDTFLRPNRAAAPWRGSTSADAVTREGLFAGGKQPGFLAGQCCHADTRFLLLCISGRGFKEAKIQPDAALYEPKLREFILPYDAVRTAEKPDEVLLDFAQSTYDALQSWASGTASRWRKKASLAFCLSTHS